MARTLTSTLRNAIDNSSTYYLLTRMEVYPSRIFFDAIESDFPVSGADAIGIQNTPMPQDIEYNNAANLVTFYQSSSVLYYALQGDSSPATTAYSCLCKPGVLGSIIYLYNGTQVVRYAINWTNIAAKSATPLSSEATIAVSLTPYALHAISATEVVSIAGDEGGFRPEYISGTTKYTSTSRFMFPKFIDWSGSARTMASLGIFSCAMKLGAKIYVFISNASSGMIEGMYFDTATGIWSHVYTALPSDLETSLCEFRISNGYARNDSLYIAGQFRRTDAYEGSQPYTLVLSSRDGHYFSVDRFTLVSNIGYRFLARVGSNNEFYIANCNRVSSNPITWVFDGINGTASTKLNIPGTHIKTISDNDLSNLSFSLSAGNEIYMNSTSLIEEAKVLLYIGMKTSAGDEDVLYGTYLLDTIEEGYADGIRSLNCNAINESFWRLTGLNMPFYAELFGKSCLFDPMTEVSGKLYTAPNSTITQTSFQIDFWKHEAYTNTASGITGISMIQSGG